MKNKKYLHNYMDFLNESYVDGDGKLQDMNFEPNSDDLWSDEEFISLTNDGLEYGKEMPEDMYKILSDEHKKIYREIILDGGGGEQLIAHSDNESLIKDLVKYDYGKLEKIILDWVETYSTFGNDNFPFDKLFIQNIDEILQGRIITKLIDKMEWSIDLPENILNSFHPRVRKLIGENLQTFDLSETFDD